MNERNPVRRLRVKHFTRAMYLILPRTALFLAACAHAWVFPSRAAAQPQLEYEVKAAFLLNFTKFIDWPPNAFSGPNSPLAICIWGEDPFGRALDQMIQGERVSGHPLIIRRIRDAPAPQTCQVLFVGSAGKDPIPPVRSLGPGVLTVGEGDEFAHEGGMIAFVIENRRVRFDVNLMAADNAGLKFSSKLLSVARSVKK